MRILIVTNYLPPKIGGIERHTHEVALELQKQQGHQVTVVSALWPKKYVTGSISETYFPYKILYFPSLTLVKRLPIPNLLNPRFWKSLKGLPNNFDLVLLQSHLFILNWIFAIRFRKSNRRIWMNHGCNFVPMNNRIGKYMSRTYEWIGIVIMRRFCNEFLAQSRNAADWASANVNRKFGVLSNAVNMDNFDNSRIEPDRKIGSSVLFVGRLVNGKGLFECIKAVSDANKVLTNAGHSKLFDLKIVGSGNLNPNQIAQQPFVIVTWVGELQHSEVLNEMLKADILIQAYSQPEGLMTVTLEALALGMLVVSTPLSGPGDLNKCRNYIPGSISDLSTHLVEASSRKESRLELISEGRAFVENNYAWPIIVKELLLGNGSD